MAYSHHTHVDCSDEIAHATYHNHLQAAGHNDRYQIELPLQRATNFTAALTMTPKHKHVHYAVHVTHEQLRSDWKAAPTPKTPTPLIPVM
jgi:hypothetical protein